MTESPDLDALELKAWKSMHQDGLWELFFGLMFLAGFFRDLTDVSAVGIIGILSSVVLFILGKRFITVPRMGLVRFGPARERKSRRLTLLIGVAVVVTFGGAYLIFGPEVAWLREREVPVGTLMAVFIFLVFVGMAHGLDYARFYFIGAVMAGHQMLAGHTETPILPLVACLLLLVPGTVLLVRFLRRYPLPTEEERHAA